MNRTRWGVGSRARRKETGSRQLSALPGATASAGPHPPQEAGLGPQQDLVPRAPRLGSHPRGASQDGARPPSSQSQSRRGASHTPQSLTPRPGGAAALGLGVSRNAPRASPATSHPREGRPARPHASPLASQTSAPLSETTLSGRSARRHRVPAHLLVFPTACRGPRPLRFLVRHPPMWLHTRVNSASSEKCRYSEARTRASNHSRRPRSPRVPARNQPRKGGHRGAGSLHPDLRVQDWGRIKLEGTQRSSWPLPSQTLTLGSFREPRVTSWPEVTGLGEPQGLPQSLQVAGHILCCLSTPSPLSQSHVGRAHGI